MGILKNKKAQLQIQETILVVFIFIVLIMFGMIFFYRLQSGSIESDFREFQIEKLTIDFITLGDMPEFSCSKAGIKESCIDTVKLAAFMNLNNLKSEKNYYFDKFSYKNITIYQVYPAKNTNKCSTGQIGDCGIWELYSKKPSKISTKMIRDTPVSLYDPDKDQYSIGIMVVEAYNV